MRRARNLELRIMLSPKPQERRETRRHHLASLATILPTNGGPQRYCRVLDISHGGVRLEVSGPSVPDEFVLLVSGTTPAKDGTYRVIWRLGREVGAMFISGTLPDL
jgi:hypothetical protein